MMLQPRSTHVVLLALLLLPAIPAAASAPGDLVTRKHPVGWERIPHPPLPGPVAAGNGAVFVPPQLKEVPCLQIDRQVVDEPAVAIHARGSGASGGASPARAAVVGANVRANDTAGDASNIPNSETPTAVHEGDPAVTVDGAGNFYYGDLYTPDNAVTSAIAVTKGSFSGCSFSFGLPVMVSTTTTDFLDKDWVAADK